MNYDYFGTGDTYPLGILYSHLTVEGIEKHYLECCPVQDIATVAVVTEGKKTPKKVIKACWDEYLPEILKLGIKTLAVTDVDYFKHITKQTKAEGLLGVACEVEGISVFYLPSYRGLTFNPEGTSQKITTALKGIFSTLTGTYTVPGSNIIHSSKYTALNKQDLNDLHTYPALTCDIETTSLIFYKAVIKTISFAWDEHNGVAFSVDDSTLPLLGQFFTDYQGKLIFHHASYDVTVLIYRLWMESLFDPKGMYEGIEVLTRNLECTRIIAYLALNSCSRASYGLKDLAQPFAGNYAIDVTDITKIPIVDILKYNLIDTLSTWYVKNTYEPKMIADQQEGVFKLFMEWMVDILQMQLTGMPLNRDTVLEVNDILTKDATTAMDAILANPAVIAYQDIQRGRWVLEKNQKLKTKRVSLADAANITFSPGSSQQLAELLYEYLELPILELTPARQPSTAGKVLASLVHHTEDPSIKELLQHICDYKAVSKILEAFMPAFLEAPYCEKLDCHLLFGSFTLGGTLSGRLSSSSINLQQLPSGGKYGKLIKSCFQAPKGYLFIGLDFASLEDRISALYTKDKAKLQVYTDGYDGHCLRAYAYSSEQMPDIDPNSVDSINSIADLYPKLRQESKAPTFALTYGGTYRTLMTNLGWLEEKARLIEQRFRQLYSHSIAVIAEKIEQATHDGYVTGAFGLRLRTPALRKTLLGAKVTPREAEAEGRTAGNMLGQSHCMLNSRAANAFMKKARTSEYKYDIALCAEIHDASYYLIPADAKILKYVNDNLVPETYWQELPEIAHPTVGLGGVLGVFYPSWAKEHEIPRYATLEDIIQLGEDVL